MHPVAQLRIILDVHPLHKPAGPRFELDLDVCVDASGSTAQAPVFHCPCGTEREMGDDGPTQHIRGKKKSGQNALRSHLCRWGVGERGGGSD